MTNETILKNGNVRDQITVFQLAITRSLEKTNVATLAQIAQVTQSFDSGIGYGIAEIMPIPKNSESDQNFTAYFFSDNFSVGDLTLCVFTNYDFRQNIKGTGNLERINTNKAIHSQMFGILIKL